MIGVDTFTYTQLTSLIGILLEFIEKYDIPIENILGHYETAKAKGKTCPNFNMDKIRQMLNKKEKNIDLANEYYNEDFDFRFKLKEM